MKLNSFLVIFLAVSLLAACDSGNKPTAPAVLQPQVTTTAQTPANPASANSDFPTLTRVEYVLSCMKEKGGKNYDNLYHCVCAVDHIATKFTHDEFLQAETFATNANMPGERGGVFRDPPQSKQLRDKLKLVIDEATAACFPNGGKISTPTKQ